ncbi:MAG TPA: flagellar basal body rod protein FlgB [Candidatus Gastranaerophilales bacterium]|nr:flagellar basal body rod protein FlgB [Candidatus Gastranaerophilales bacterium]
MDILEKRNIEITTLAMDGLSQRHKAIASNIANADSKGYKRVELNFEDQLQKIIATDKRKEEHKINNMLNASNEPLEKGKFDMGYSDFNLQTTQAADSNFTDGNNVNIEKEMADLTKNGMTYNALATLQQKAFKSMSDVIQQGGNS